MHSAFLLVLYSAFLLGAASAAETPLVSAAMTRAAGLEGRLVWVDGYANMDVLGSRAGIAGLMEQMRRARVNTVVFGAKMFGGQTLFPSEIAPQLIEWRGQSVPADLNILQTVIEEAHARGLKVHASVDVFSDGHRLARKGPAYEHPEWQTVIYSVRRELSTADGQRLPIYAVNPDGNLGEVVTAYTPGYGWRKPKNPDPEETQVYTILAGPADDMRVIAVTDCSLVRDYQLVEMPRDGLLLHGRGALADWMLRALRVGERVQFVAVERFLPIASDELEGSALFLNPVLPEVRQRALRQIEEIARKYDVDGITFDRMRFSGINADFSDYTRARFEEHLGKKVESWPHDILRVDPIPGRLIVRGPLFNPWVEWRAGQITSFLKQSVASVRAIKPRLRIGAYVGSWYDRYYGEGVNWASPEYSAALDWMNATYGQTGYARELDYITTGCYYRRPTRELALVDDYPVESTVEAAAQLSARVVSDAAFVYGGLDLNQYESKDAAGNRRFDSDSFRAGIATARGNSQGVMLFDSVHLNRNRAWSVLEEEFASPAIAPHDVPNLLTSVRRVREALQGTNK